MEEEIEEVKEEVKNKKPHFEYFAILFGTDNLVENKDINELWLGKYGKVKIDDEEKLVYAVYKLKVNSMVNIKFYYKLLVEGDFSNSDFKITDLDEIKTSILSRKAVIKKAVFTRGLADLKNYIREILGE